MSDNGSSSGLTRFYLKHRAEPGTFACEGDAAGAILGALDVTDEQTKGGLCPHMLSSLPLAGRVDDLDYLNRERDNFEPFVPECGNVHHLLEDLLDLERAHVTAINEYAEADAEAKTRKKAMEAAGQKVHALLIRISERKPLPLFDAAGV